MRKPEQDVINTLLDLMNFETIGTGGGCEAKQRFIGNYVIVVSYDASVNWEYVEESEPACIGLYGPVLPQPWSFDWGADNMIEIRDWHDVPTLADEITNFAIRAKDLKEADNLAELEALMTLWQVICNRWAFGEANADEIEMADSTAPYYKDVKAWIALWEGCDEEAVRV